MTAEEYGQLLDRCGWLGTLDDSSRSDLLARIERLISDGGTPHSALASVVFEQMTLDEPWQPRSMKDSALAALAKYVEGSGGVFAPEEIEWADDGFDGGRLTFRFGGNAHEGAIGYADDDGDDRDDGGVRALVNEALRESAAPQRFIPLPECREFQAGYAFVSPEIYVKAFGGAIPNTGRNPMTGSEIRLPLPPEARQG